MKKELSCKNNNKNEREIDNDWNTNNEKVKN